MGVLGDVLMSKVPPHVGGVHGDKSESGVDEVKRNMVKSYWESTTVDKDQV